MKYISVLFLGGLWILGALANADEGLAIQDLKNNLVRISRVNDVGSVNEAWDRLQAIRRELQTQDAVLAALLQTVSPQFKPGLLNAQALLNRRSQSTPSEAMRVPLYLAETAKLVSDAAASIGANPSAETKQRFGFDASGRICELLVESESQIPMDASGRFI